MKKLLVPVDFSKYSEYALEVAATLAKQNNSEIIVLHMMGLSEAILTKDEAQEATEAQFYMRLAEKRFNTFLDKPYLKGIKVSEMVQNYKIFSEINTVVNENDVDLIVMGSHGSSGLEEVFVGSNTEKVVRTSDVPVLVIKHRAKDFNVKEVVFACDFKMENIGVYHKAMKLFKLLGSNVRLVYVNLPDETFKSTSQIEEHVSEFLFKAESGDLSVMDKVVYLNDYSVESALFKYSDKIGADIIALPTHGRRGIAHFFSGSITERIANHSELPVLTFKI
ncbi:universal stress protein [Aquimarina intermedia]|uniref:Nucleotide-binding universal stress UspA family protein n=1 Tax=Aquimarina intermedia TaxID=350814 RepID=A0A5S5C4C9_9FLAO|nr:universal stress protein [Aquimarina intermedia]TYP74285.1 nucleotide-binding universal stress UspA family protein [Aquimarina intermedia]